ncbi:hypothetical protein HELRODRAFT_164680 [Helobdella robusta]|uniref:Uncharacterized protein n=1 Tax=Helobdella robusta TaxID=6412 RepID=T1EVP9_HELRO|nr:hypothetical protein HELRODRAFT_164680 [Helobdella robusta]ESN92605.1 hypothetical protein HELRODRAFT_164680 [Helobdella robusta]
MEPVGVVKKDNLLKLHSETQRIVRESSVKLPYHKPAKQDLSSYLARVQQKRESIDFTNSLKKLQQQQLKHPYPVIPNPTPLESTITRQISEDTDSTSNFTSNLINNNTITNGNSTTTNNNNNSGFKVEKIIYKMDARDDEMLKGSKLRHLQQQLKQQMSEVRSERLRERKKQFKKLAKEKGIGNAISRLKEDEKKDDDDDGGSSSSGSGSSSDDDDDDGNSGGVADGDDDAEETEEEDEEEMAVKRIEVVAVVDDGFVMY